MLRVTQGVLPPTVPIQFTTNDGIAVPALGNINIVTANATVLFTGAGSTITQDFGLNNLILGSNPAGLPSGNGVSNAGVGGSVLNALTSGSSNAALGYTAMQFVTTGNGNSAVGFEALRTLVSGNLNSAFGSLALASLTNNGLSGNTTAIGGSALQHLQTGVSNIALGALAAQNYTGAESSNIIIGNNGVNGESNVIRIGTQGTGIGQQNQTFIAGVLNTVSGRVVNVTIPGAYPYTTLITDDAIFVDSSSARTIIPLANPKIGTTYKIKDRVGSAAANNITITPSGKTIDGSASFIINSNYGSINITYNGTEWSIL